MNTSIYIAKKLLGSGTGRDFSKPIVGIAIASVALGTAVMILSLFVVRGFQQEVKDKVIGFGSHLQVAKAANIFSKETPKIEIDRAFYNEMAQTEGIKNIQIFALNPGMIETNENLQAAIIKGISKDFDWEFFEERLVEGEVLDFSKERNNEVLISQYMANRLELKLGEKLTLYFIRQESDIKPRQLTVKGIYSTGLEDFDKQFVFVDIAHIQKINGWGLEAQIKVAKQANENGEIEIAPLGFGGDGNFKFDFPELGLAGAGPHFIKPTRDTTIMMVLNDGKGKVKLNGQKSAADTAWATIKFDAGDGQILPEYKVETRTSGGSHKYYTGGYEINLDGFDRLSEFEDLVHEKKPLLLNVTAIDARNPDIFGWLEMLDINVYIIIILMAVVAIVNTSSALLIIILERTNMIGILKAFGITNQSVKQVFLFYAAVILGVGLLLGNFLSIGLALLQEKYHFVKLNAESYYVNEVPILFDWSTIIWVNIFALIVGVVCLVLPASYVSRVTPVKAIRFD